MKRKLATAALVASIGLVAAGCGGSTKQAAAPAGYGQTGGQTSGQTARTPGGSGKVTDVTGSTAQVQSQDSQVAVSWTGSTTFTKEVATDLSAVKVGSCVTAFASQTTGTATPTDAVAATTVRIVPSNDGTCTLPGAFGGGVRGGDGGTPPSGSPEGGTGTRPTDRPTNGNGRGFGAGAIGKVLKVTSSGFTVASEERAPGSTTSTTKDVTVTTSGSTVFSTTAEAAASDVKVGVCVTSTGKANDTGAIAATTISVSQPVDGACGLGGFAARPQS